MRIALFTETYVPYINGVITHVKLLKEGLEKLGHEVLIVCAEPKYKKYVLKNGILYCPGIMFKKVYDYGVATPISPIRYRYIKNFRPDIIHIHTEFGVGYSGAIAAKNLGVPLIYTLHTMYDEYLYYIAPKHLIGIAKKSAHAYARFLAERATCLTGPSKKVEEYFKSVGIDKKVHIIPNPVETDIFTPNCINGIQKHKLRGMLNVSDDTLLLCFCGRLGKEKNVDVLLNYWAKEMKDEMYVKLLIIGDGPVKSALEEQAKQLQIGEQVRFIGKVAHEKLPPYYAASDLYITASLSDTNSISMLEAMSAGMPVIHIKDDLNKGQVIDGYNGFIYKDAQEMKEKIILYRELSLQSKEKIRNDARVSVLSLGAEALAKKLLEVYRMGLEIKKSTS